MRVPVIGNEAGAPAPAGAPSPAWTTLAITVLSTRTLPTVVLVGLLGLVGLSANPVLSSPAVRLGGAAPTLAVAMSVAAYDLGTAAGTGIGGPTLDSGLGAVGPAVVGTVVVALTSIPTTAPAVAGRRGGAAGS